MTRLRRRLADDGGFTLIELLMSSSLMLVVLVATLTTFNAFQRSTDRSAKQNDMQESARSTIITLSRQLRNLAGPTANQPGSVDRAGATDLVFKSVDPNGPSGGANAASVRRLRFCLGNTVPAKIYMQVQTWTTASPPAVPTDTTCPGAGWAVTTTMAYGVTNVRPGYNRPLFLYDSFDLPSIDAIRSQIYVDADINRLPPETELESGVFLRNQNRAPTASFQWSPGGLHHVLLNASGSGDPEAQPITYTWKEGATTLGTDAVLDWSSTIGNHSVTLEVRDTAGLVGTVTQTVPVS